jgi:glycosyltransferase involved in cell wall biosynthesis
MLKRAIQSVLNQTFPAFQVCVYDNASNDDTKTVVDELAKNDSRVKYYRHEENIGAAANFQFGLEKVDTPFFSFLSDDDLILPNFFESAMQSLNSHPDAMFYAGLTIVTKDEKFDRIAKDGGRFGYFSPPEGLLDILNTSGLLWQSIVFRSNVVDHVGLLDLDVGGSADWDFELRVAAHHPIIISNEPSAIWTLHEQSWWATASDYRIAWPGYQRMIDKMILDESLSLEAKIQVKKKLNEALVKNLSELGRRALSKREFDNVYVIGDILAHFCDAKAESLVLVDLSRLRELSELAYLLVNQIRRLYRLGTRPRTFLSNRKRSKELQKQYGKYLHYLDKYAK